ncbi:MAG: hypothetical protein Q7T71_01040 [Herbiconiux sp.]|nr:hypothetical protein [Herbiconiux sp.]
MPLLLPGDTSPLDATPSPGELRAYRRGRGPLSGPPVRVRPCFGGVSYTALLAVCAPTTAALVAVQAEPRLIAVGVLVSAGSAVAALLCARATRVRTCLREYRLAAFAQRNGLVYERGAERPSVPGLVYSATPGRPLRRFTGVRSGQPVEVGNYEHPTGDVSGYVLVGDAVEIVPPFDFSAPAEWYRAWRLLDA